MYTKITVMFCLDIALMNSSNEYKMEGKKTRLSRWLISTLLYIA